MDSSVPPPPPTLRHKLRPWYLVAAMALTWFVGVRGMNAGFSAASFLRSGILPAGPAGSPHDWTMAELWQVAAIEHLRALLDHARVTFPLAVANAILSALLVIASGLAMGGRRGARSLALQALGANALLWIVEFALTAGVRTEEIQGFLRTIEPVALPPEQRALLANPRFHHWALGFWLVVFDLGPLALGALALTRARTKVYFEAAARAAERTDEP